MNSDGTLQHALLLSALAIATALVFVALHHFGVGVLPKLPGLPRTGR
jgi:hypothetical protein